MESLTRSLNFELPHDLHFDKYAQQILENSKTIVPVASVASTTIATPTLTPLSANLTGDLLQRIGATLLNSIQLQRFIRFDTGSISASPTAIANATDASAKKMELADFAPNHINIDSSSFDTMDEMQKQLEYDKFMNEVWIGIVLTLVLISLVFCICSCFLYHQFRTWKRNYRNTVPSSTNGSDHDPEAVKLHTNFDDPVPEYTLVSGLPSYEAALELLHKTPKSCLLVYPSVYSVFNKNELTTSTATATAAPSDRLRQPFTEATTPLLPSELHSPETPEKLFSPLPSYAEANAGLTVITTIVSEKSPAAGTRLSPATSLTQPATPTTPTIATTTNALPSFAHSNYIKAPSYEGPTPPIKQ